MCQCAAITHENEEAYSLHSNARRTNDMCICAHNPSQCRHRAPRVHDHPIAPQSQKHSKSCKDRVTAPSSFDHAEPFTHLPNQDTMHDASSKLSTVAIPPHPISTMAIPMTSKSPQGAPGGRARYYQDHDATRTRKRPQSLTRASSSSRLAPCTCPIASTSWLPGLPTGFSPRDGDAADCRAPSVLVGPCAARGGPWGAHLQLPKVRRGRSGERAGARRLVGLRASPSPSPAPRGTHARTRTAAIHVCVLSRAPSPTTQDVMTRREETGATFSGVLRPSLASFLRMTPPPSPPRERVTVCEKLDRRARHRKGDGWSPGSDEVRVEVEGLLYGLAVAACPRQRPRLHSHTARTPHAARVRPACVRV